MVYPCPDRPQIRFVLHLGGGRSIELPFYSGWENIRQRVEDPNVILLPNPIMRWVNPRPDVQIENIDFVGAGTGEPVLLAITAAIAGS